MDSLAAAAIDVFSNVCADPETSGSRGSGQSPDPRAHGLTSTPPDASVAFTPPAYAPTMAMKRGPPLPTLPEGRPPTASRPGPELAKPAGFKKVKVEPGLECLDDDFLFTSGFVPVGPLAAFDLGVGFGAEVPVDGASRRRNLPYRATLASAPGFRPIASEKTLLASGGFAPRPARRARVGGASVRDMLPRRDTTLRGRVDRLAYEIGVPSTTLAATVAGCCLEVGLPRDGNLRDTIENLEAICFTGTPGPELEQLFKEATY